MGFFGSGEDDEGERAASLARIEAGGIPISAEARLRDLSTKGDLFTSGLSVNEFSLLAQLGPQPLAQVMGASVIRTGWQYLPALPAGLPVTTVVQTRYGRSVPAGGILQNRYGEASPSQVRNYLWHAEVVCELDVLTDAWNLARRGALDRLSEEARQTGADVVISPRERSSTSSAEPRSGTRGRRETPGRFSPTCRFRITGGCGARGMSRLG